MYQALYRKYRPKTFDDIVGQDIIKKTIRNSVINNNLSHAYLFCGPRGTGKTSTAKLISKLINCQSLKNENPCEECEFCRNFNTESLDVIEIDAASNNGVDEIRELKNKINIMPSIGKYKVYIIDEVHMLSMGAFNALLKTLEEPPKHVIFILATTEINKIPETIISRCQRYDFKRVNEKSITKRLKYISEAENISVDENVLEAISRVSDGGLRDAIGLLDKAIAYCNGNSIKIDDLNEIAYITPLEDVEKLINYIQMFDIKQYVYLIDKLNDNGKDLIKLVNELMIHVRNCIINSDNIKNKNFYLKLINELNDLSYKMKNATFPKILLEMLIINVNKENINQLKTTNNSVEIKEKQTNNKSKKVNNYSELKAIRINNTLSAASKSELVKVKSEWKNIKQYMLEDKYSKLISFLPDLEIVAASPTNILLSDKYEVNIDSSIDNFQLIECLINTMFQNKYKIMFLDKNEWNKIKKEYVNNTKNNIKYEYKEENADYNNIFEKER